MAAFCQANAHKSYRHPRASRLPCKMLILTSSLGIRIGRAEPRRTDLRRGVSRQKRWKGLLLLHLDALLGSSMPLMMGLTMAASRSTTNSNPSPETRVTYLLGGARSSMVMRELA